MAGETQNGSGSEIRNKYRFQVYTRENGVDTLIAGFTTVTGIELEVNVVEWRVGDQNETKKLPGFINYPPIVGERGFDAGGTLKDWFDLVHNISNGSGAGEYRKDLVIKVLNRTGTVFKQILAHDAWPSKYTASDLDASSEDPWTETVELQHNGWEYEDVGTVPSPENQTS